MLFVKDGSGAGMATQADKPKDKHLAAIDAAMRRGDLLVAFDAARKAAEAAADALIYKHRAVLALARAGATANALKLFAEWKLDKAVPADSALAVDIPSLKARLLKDQALADHSSLRRERLEEAAAAYARVFELTGDAYPGVNAAALLLWAGRLEAAQRTAAAVLKASTARDYYGLATQAEAQLILGHVEEARRLIADAGAVRPVDTQGRAATRRQLRRTCQQLGIAEAILAPLEPRPVIHYVGHLIGPHFKESDEPAAAAAIGTALEELDVGYGFGSLAAGADILFAEALLAREAELHVVIPFELDEFRSVSVASAGAAWLPRFQACLERATRVVMATSDGFAGASSVFSYGGQYAMGLALQRASFLDGRALQIALWDESPPSHSQGLAGTGAEVRLWRSAGHPTLVISPDGRRHDYDAVPDWPTAPSVGDGRRLCAFLFGDVHGFSKLTERQIPAFVHGVLGAMGQSIREYERNVLWCNTWGDGLFLVFDDVAAATACALAIQERVALIDLNARELPLTIALRIGCHYGPVNEMFDPVVGRVSFFGAHVTRAARIEPITPVGSVYVTEPFAAALALRPDAPYAREYVGTVPLAKGYGDVSLYAIRRLAKAPAPSAR
ncbi:MAG: TRAFs-binding domain-containing protein [Alphaproteobacteria bacterium]